MGNIASVRIVLHLTECRRNAITVSGRKLSELLCCAFCEVETVVHEGLFLAVPFRRGRIRAGLGGSHESRRRMVSPRGIARPAQSRCAMLRAPAPSGYGVRPF